MSFGDDEYKHVLTSSRLTWWHGQGTNAPFIDNKCRQWSAREMNDKLQPF
jgi:hypothetical protein